MKKDSFEAYIYLKPLILAFEKAANEKEAKGMKAYMLNQFEFYGIKTPQRDALVKSFLKIYRIQQYNELEKVVKYMWSQKEREWQYAAIDLLASHITLWKASSIKLIQYCLINKSWWDTVDGIGSDWLTKYFTLYPEQILPVTKHWNVSKNIWLQRSSILFQRSYKKKTNTQLLSDYILQHQSSKEFFIQKAIGWALREYSKTNPEWVLAFIAEKKIAPLSKREAIRRIMLNK